MTIRIHKIMRRRNKGMTINEVIGMKRKERVSDCPGIKTHWTDYPVQEWNRERL